MNPKKKYLSGFTFIKNGLTLGYPIRESIESIAPLCDEIIINVGYDDPRTQKDDGTYTYLRDHFPQNKFIFFRSHWDPNLTASGLVLSQQTNLALARCQGLFGQYIQGDECLHEKELPLIEDKVRAMDKNKQAQGLVFQYHHFYGNVDVVKKTRTVYRKEVRTIRLGQGIQSHLDAQGFKTAEGEKLRCLETQAHIYHYGWARADQVMKKKIVAMDRLYHGEERKDRGQTFNYERIWGLEKFKGTHPAIMRDWIQFHQNDLDILSLPRTYRPGDLRLILSDTFEKITGHRLGEYKNYQLIH